MEKRKISKSLFNLSHTNKFSCDMGTLIPILAEDLVPGDVFEINPVALVRFNAMLRPLQHEVNVRIEGFFTPNRLVWDNWETYITGPGVSGDTPPVHPYLTSPAGPTWSVAEGTLADFLGIPTQTFSSSSFNTLQINALPFRMCNLIYNEWYRDQDLQDKLVVNKTDGGDNYENYVLQRRNWEKDYFTSARPFTQKGEDVQLPLGGTAPVVITNEDNQLAVGAYNTLSNNNTFNLSRVNGAIVAGDGGGNLDVFGDYNNNRSFGIKGQSTSNDNMDSVDKELVGIADLSTASASNIRDIRYAFQLQKFLELDARAGTRYAEWIRAHFGTLPQDYRLQRPEFLGGMSTIVNISEVLQTSATSGSAPLADLAGHGYGICNGKIRYKAQEHGWIILFLSVMPRTAYQQGLPRRLSRNTRFDYLTPEFVHVGEQAVLNKEVYLNGNDTSEDNDVWGYQGRYDEYRRRESSVRGAYRSSLNNWHMGRIFNELPELNGDFVTAQPTDRIFAVSGQTGKSLAVQVVNRVRAIRPLPNVAVPGLVDH